MLPYRYKKLWVLRVLSVAIGGLLAIMTSFPASQNVHQYMLDIDDLKRIISADVGKKLPQKETNRTLNGDKLSIKVNNIQRNQFENVKPTVMSTVTHNRNKSHQGVHKIGIINPHPYKYILTPNKVCQGGSLAVMFVHSAPAHHKKRQLIRETWGNKRYHGNRKLQVVYVVASPVDQAVRQAITKEHTIHQDILSENFIDNYKNLTLKAVGALKWILKNCVNTKFIVKTDDDTMVNVFALTRHLSDLKVTGQTSGLLMCRNVGGMPVLRTGKWAVSVAEYPNTHYPPYCSGLAYIMTRDVAESLYKASYRTRNVWVDDAWMTGMVAKTAGVSHTNIAHVYSLDKAIVEQKFLGKDWYQYLFAHLGPLAFKNIWAKMSSLALKNKIPKSGKVIPGIVVNR